MPAPSDDAAEAAAIYTIDKYIKGVDDQASHELPEIYWWKEKSGQFKYGQHGPGVSWLARLEQFQAEGFARETRLDVVRRNRTQRATLQNRGYGMGEMLHWTDIQENGAPEALENLLTDMLDAMKADILVAPVAGLYDDGTDTTYDGLGFQGSLSFMKTTGSYAGISMTEYPEWASPSITTSQAPYNAFTSEPLPVLDEMVKHMRENSGGPAGRTAQKPDVAFMDWDLFLTIKATLIRRYQLTLPQNKDIQAFGNFEHFMYNGVTWFPTFNIPAAYADNVFVYTSDTICWEFPTSKFINEFRQEEGIPRSIYVLFIIYGRIRCKAPRRNARFKVG